MPSSHHSLWDKVIKFWKYFATSDLIPMPLPLPLPILSPCSLCPSGYLLNFPGTLICRGLWGSLTCCAVTQNVLFEFIEEITITVTRRRSPHRSETGTRVDADMRRYDTTTRYDVLAFKRDANSIWGLVLGWIAGFGTRVGAARATRAA